MLTHNELKARAPERADVKNEYDRLDEEFRFLDEFLKARAAAGVTQTEQRIALLIYFILTIPLLWLVYAVIAPFAVRITGLDMQATRGVLLLISAAACALTAVRIARDKAPLKRLGKIASRRPNSGSDKFLAELATRTYDTTHQDEKK